MVKRLQLRTINHPHSNDTLISSTRKYPLKVNNYRKKKKATNSKGRRIKRVQVSYINSPQNTTQYLIKNYCLNHQGVLEHDEKDIDTWFDYENMIPTGSMMLNDLSYNGNTNYTLVSNSDYDYDYDIFANANASEDIHIMNQEDTRNKDTLSTNSNTYEEDNDREKACFE